MSRRRSFGTFKSVPGRGKTYRQSFWSRNSIRFYHDLDRNANNLFNHFGRLCTLPPAQSAGPPANGKFSNDWKKIFQWLEKQAEISNDWKNFSPVFQRLEKIFAGGEREDFQPQRTQRAQRRREEGREGRGGPVGARASRPRRGSGKREKDCPPSRFRLTFAWHSGIPPFANHEHRHDTT